MGFNSTTNDEFDVTRVAVGVAEVQADTGACRAGLTIKALSTNTDFVYVGKAGVVAGTGFELDAGEEVFIPARNADLVYVIGGAASQAICVLKD